LFDLITGGNLAVPADPVLRLAVSRAVAVETGRGWRISKEKQSHKIDVVIALAMACHAAVEGQTKMTVMVPPGLVDRIRSRPPYVRPLYAVGRRSPAGMIGERRAGQLRRLRGL
jgi:hypothetical protein